MTTTTPATKQPHVIIIGGGFGGLYAARSLRKFPGQVTLIDRRNYHLFQPLLYQVATGALSPANIAAPLRCILKKQRNTRVLLGEVSGLDPAKKEVTVNALPDEQTGAGQPEVLHYDYLVVATGASHDYFGKPEWAALAPGLKTIEDATEIRKRVLLAFEHAERETDPDKVKSWLTFAVVGAGPTGVELAGALAEVSKDTLHNEFRKIDPQSTRIVLLDGAQRVLPVYTPELSAKAEAALNRLGAEVKNNAIVKDLQPGLVVFEQNGKREELEARTVLWAAGVKASPLGRMLNEKTGVELDRAGRVKVNSDLSIPNFSDVFVIGDLALSKDGEKFVPGVAPAAMQMGSYVAQTIRGRLKGQAPKPFKYHDKGSMATIGRGAAVADLGFIRFSGFFAWLAWLFIHLMFVVQFGNRLLVLMQWGWNYITFNRSARLITQVHAQANPPGNGAAPGKS